MAQQEDQPNDAAAKRCLVLASLLLGEASSLAKAAASNAIGGNTAGALEIAFNAEPLVPRAKTLLQAASVLASSRGS